MNPQECHIDLVALQDLKDIMESEFETLIDTFINDSNKKIEELSLNYLNQNSEELRKSAHSLKGSSSNVCAIKLSELAKQIEHRARQQELAGIDALIQALDIEFQIVAQQLSDQLIKK